LPFAWVQTVIAGQIGAAEGMSGSVIFADFSSKAPENIFEK
jgi:hypothetical protein